MSWPPPGPDAVPGGPSLPGPSTTSGRGSPIVATSVVLVVLVVTAAAVVAATRPPGLPAGLRDYLPSQARTDALSHPSGETWQVAQGFLSVSSGAAALTTPALESLPWTDDPEAPQHEGRWLLVDYSEPGRTGELRTNNLLVADDRVTLQAVEGPTAWLTYDPGLPVLVGGAEPGRSIDWHGSITFGVDDDESQTIPGTAQITTSKSRSLPGCLDSTAQLQMDDGSETTRATTWCSGTAAGWAGETIDGSTILRTEGDPTTPATGFDTPRARPRRTTGDVSETGWFRYVLGGMFPIPRFSAEHTAMAGNVLVTARSSGLLEAWAGYRNGPPDQSNRYLSWRAQPGGVVTALTTAGSVTIAASSVDAVTAYGSDGGQLWRVDTRDMVTSLYVADDLVLLLHASGRIRALDVRTGTERWSARFADDASAAVGSGRIAVVADEELSVLDASTGARIWSGSTTTDEPPVVLGKTAVTLEPGGDLVARSLQHGDLRWSRIVDPLARISGNPAQLAVRGVSSTLALDPAGAVRWRAPHSLAVQVVGSQAAVMFTDRVELWDADGQVQSWPYPAGLRSTTEAVITDRGVLLPSQPGPDGYQEMEYR